MTFKLLAVLGGGVPGDLMKAFDEERQRGKGQTIGNLPDGQLGGFQQDLGALDFGIADVEKQGDPGFLFELAGQIILRVAGERRQIGDPDLPVQTQLNVIAAFLDGGGVVRIYM